MSSWLYQISYALGQVAFMLLLAPLLSGIIKKIKAFWQCRRGPGVLQVYYDIFKYLRKDTVVSEHTSWIFLANPYISLGAVLVVATLVPVLAVRAPLGFTGDFILLVYLLAVARFFTALAGLDAGSAFGGMGSSREMAVSAMVEPALVMAFFSVAVRVQSTNLSQVVESLAGKGWQVITPGHLLAIVAFFVVVIAETGRIPVDNPDTHLELTMIHEGMLLEYSGKPLGLLLWAASVKQLLVLTLMANIFFPWGLAEGLNGAEILVSLIVYLIKIVILGAGLAVVETSLAKVRLFKVPELLGASFMLSVLAVAANFMLRG